MSILAEVFVSTKSDALRYEVETKSGHEPAAERFEVVRYSRLTSLEFGTLWAILESAEWDVNRHMLKSLAHSDETWLEEFPDSYVSLLASAEEDHLLSASKAWGGVGRTSVRRRRTGANP